MKTKKSPEPFRGKFQEFSVQGGVSPPIDNALKLTPEQYIKWSISPKMRKSDK